MASTAFVAIGHGYEAGSMGRCEAFDPYDILANPLGGFGNADRESRSFPSPSGGPGVTYSSHAVYLMRRKDARPGDKELYVAVHHGGGRQIWRLPCCYHYTAETVAALLARVEAIEARLSTLPAESEAAPTGEVVPFPNAARPRRTAAHERVIRRAWAERKAARLQRAIAADHMRMREQVQDALRTAVERERIERAKRKRAAQRARRVTADLRQDIAQARKRREWWEGAARRQFSKRAAIEKQETFQRQRADVLHAQLTRLRQDMADPSQPERASDLAQLIRERDEARTALAALQRRAETAEKARDGMADAFEALAVRVARAEAALRKAA